MPNVQQIAVAAETDELNAAAKLLAESLGLTHTSVKTTNYLLLLVLTPSRLELRFCGKPPLNPIFVDFIAGKLAYRRQHGGGGGQLIARAVNSKQAPRVLDLTAGLAQDAFVLATLGCQVTMLERNPIIAALLRDGLTRAQQHDWFNQLTIKLIESEAKNYLTQLDQHSLPDVIYLDPMFPDMKRTALVKKEMRILRLVVGDDLDAGELLELAKSYARKRVVVKRPRLAPRLTDENPDVVFTGKSSRFDVYLKA